MVFCSRRFLLYFFCCVMSVSLPANVFCWQIRDKIVPSSQVITTVIVVTLAAFEAYDRFFGADKEGAIMCPEQWICKESESDSDSVVAAKSDLRSIVEVLKRQGRDLVKTQRDCEYHMRRALARFMKNPEGISESEKRLLLLYNDEKKIKNFVKNYKTMQDRIAGVKQFLQEQKRSNLEFDESPVAGQG